MRRHISALIILNFVCMRSRRVFRLIWNFPGRRTCVGHRQDGGIAKGYMADLAFIDLAALHYVPANDVVAQLVFGEDGTGVESVMCGGHLILDKRRLVNVDVSRVRSVFAPCPSLPLPCIRFLRGWLLVPLFSSGLSHDAGQ